MLQHAVAALAFVAGSSARLQTLRPPCTPLDVASPYQSTWSCADNLFDESPRFWTGELLEMVGLMQVDSKTFRFMGVNNVAATPVQKELQVAPTSTTYVFEAAGVRLTLSFVTPATDLDMDIVMASRPVTHLTFDVVSVDGSPHNVQVYFDSPAFGVVNNKSEVVTWSRPESTSLAVMQIGSKEQHLLGAQTDLINWGYSMIAAPAQQAGLHTVMHSAEECQAAFAAGKYTQLKDDESGPRAASDRRPVLSVAWDFGKLQPEQASMRTMMLALNQVMSIRFFGTEMPPLWLHHWDSAVDMLEASHQRRDGDVARASMFDKELIENLTVAGGTKYATLASLAYRQVTGGTQAVWNPVKEEPWVFMKEISSDGDVSTVDVIFPAFPMFHYLYPEYFRLIMVPLLVYGANETKQYGMDIPYNKAWAPHHLGTWPICDLPANKQEDMPVEESADMLIMIAGLHKVQGSLDYLSAYWPMLDSWADFIVSSLPDPGNQLCTDDFEGPSPHNTNLAAKGIVGLEAYAQVLDANGDAARAEKYRQAAFGFVGQWEAMGRDGDHYRIQFNLPGTWSMKYNLLWQKVLGLKAFPQDVFDREAAYYQTKLETCGVPLDNRHLYTKTDWSLWTASIGTQDQFEAIVNGMFKFANTTTSRVPFSDWYDVSTCEAKGFRARPVQGGLFAKMLVNAGNHLTVYA